MKNAFPLKATPVNSKRLVEWVKLITITGIGQIIVQVLGLISGIIIIRLLPSHEYALYTLANTMLGTMTILADGGIASGVMSEGGKVWDNRIKLGAVIQTGLQLRRRFAIISLIVSLPILVYFLLQHGATIYASISIIIALSLAFFAALSDSLLEVSVKLNQDVKNLQKNQVITGLGRLLLISTGVLIFPFTFIALLGNGIPRIWGNLRLRKISNKFADNSQDVNPEVRKNILRVVSRILPGSIYYCIAGQFTIWLISIFGSTTSIAQVGAIGRLAMLITLITVFFQMLVVPWFSKLPAKRTIMLKKYLQINALLLIVSLLIIIVVRVFTSQALAILGKQYSNLSFELYLNILAVCISLFGSVSFMLYTNRGWAMNPIISIGVSLLSIIIGCFFIELSTIRGVLYLSIFSASIQSLMHMFFCARKIHKVER